MRVRTLVTLLVVSVAAIPTTLPTMAVALASPTAAVAPVGPGHFSTAARVVHRAPSPAPNVTGIRVGHHRSFDRVVVDLAGAAPGFDVRYVRRLVRDPSGKTVDLLGPASLRLVLRPANGHDPNSGTSTLRTPARTKWKLDQVRETAVIGDFEAVFTVGIGVARRAPFRVLTLRHPTRIVVDVRH